MLTAVVTALSDLSHYISMIVRAATIVTFNATTDITIVLCLTTEIIPIVHGSSRPVGRVNLIEERLLLRGIPV